MQPPSTGGAADRLGADLHRAMLDSALDAIVGMDAGGVITEFNPAAERMFGYTRAEAVGQRMADLIVPPALRQQHAAGLARHVAGAESRILGRRIEITAMRRDGSEFPVELSIQRVGQAVPPIFTGFIRDITEHKELEALVRHSQKMDAIGQLAGGVAHDFNNILTVIQGHTALLVAGGGGKEADQDSVRQIAEAAARAAGLTRQLLAFSRKQVIQATTLDLNEVVSNMSRMLQRILGEDVKLSVKPSPRPSMVHGDAGMMEQIVLNLAVNARDAMPEGGRLTIATATEQIGAAFVRDNPEATPGRYVCLSVSDSGCGIATEHLSRIFEPFFTTKGVHKGTGLGLATVYGIVKQHKGWMTVQSEIGKGSTFTVYLPLNERPSAITKRRVAESARGGQETILLVEDEAPVRMLARMVLERSGYAVLDAPHGLAALAIWKAERDRVDLVFTDMVMPEGMSGRQLADHVLADRPEMRIIITSGYSVEVFGKELAPSDNVTFIQKPYSPEPLLACVRAMLDKRIA
jgi:two-component system cell cycle sensor histidine kinase/response regulator CckA